MMGVRKRTHAVKKDAYGLRAPAVATFSSGCTLLDCVLGGGWAYSRIANIIGDKSTGKTLLAIEACANFAVENPNGKIVYAESEAAFDNAYAASLGLPDKRVEMPEVFTVEDVFEDLEKRLTTKTRTLYVIDSMDALSDRGEQKRTMDEGTYGTKSKQVSEWLRRQNQKLSKSKITLIVVSQVRDNLGVSFGERHKRSGGKALDFYATHALWLAHLAQIHKTRKKVKRVVGVRVRAKCKKNKIGSPFRECDFPLMFGFGVEDVQAGLLWLIEVKRTNAIGMTDQAAKKLANGLDRLSVEQYEEERANISAAVKEVWAEIEDGFRPRRSKYREA